MYFIQSLRAFRRAGNVKLFGRRLGGLGREEITVQWWPKIGFEIFHLGVWGGPGRGPGGVPGGSWGGPGRIPGGFGGILEDLGWSWKFSGRS